MPISCITSSLSHRDTGTIGAGMPECQFFTESDSETSKQVILNINDLL